MFMNIIKKSISLLLVMVITAGLCCAAETQDNKTVEEVLTEKAADLGDQYGFMSLGTKAFPAEDKMTALRFPEEIAEHEQGILFSEIYDYDGDGTAELLLFRRQIGYVNFEHEGGTLSGLERSEYLFEMYEYFEQDRCLLRSRFVVGAADIFTPFTSHSSMTVFRKDLDGRTELFMEVFLSGQDHPEDICLLRLRYENGYFCDYSGIRYGAMYFGDDNVRCMESKSIESFETLCYSGSNNDKLWDLKTSANDYDESFKNTLKTSLEDFGLTLITTRYDANKTLDDPTAIHESSALDYYGTAGGTLTPLAFTYLHRAPEIAEEGCTGLKLHRSISTKDPAGIDRPSLDMQ